jgi:hypothetical protein
MPQGEPKKMDSWRPSWTLGSGTYNPDSCEFGSVRHFQSKVFVLVDDDWHAFDIWEDTRNGKRSSVAKLQERLHFVARDPTLFTVLLAVFQSGMEG